MIGLRILISVAVYAWTGAAAAVPILAYKFNMWPLLFLVPPVWAITGLVWLKAKQDWNDE